MKWCFASACIISWKIGYFSPETCRWCTTRKLFEKVSGKRFTPAPVPSCIAGCKTSWATTCVTSFPKPISVSIRYSRKPVGWCVARAYRILVIDPTTHGNTQIRPAASETQYIDNFLDKLTNFAVLNDCLVILVAHPQDETAMPARAALIAPRCMTSTARGLLQQVRLRLGGGAHARCGAHLREKVKFRQPRSARHGAAGVQPNQRPLQPVR